MKGRRRKRVTTAPAAPGKPSGRQRALAARVGPLAAGLGLPGIPEWEATKASTRNLSHDAAVRECAFLSTQYRNLRPGMANFSVHLDRCLQALAAKKVPFVLTGAYGISTWTGRPRATRDVDILVKAGRNHARAVNVLKELFPQLEVRSFPGLVAFFVPGETDSVIYVTYPHRADIEETLRTAIWVQEKSLRYRIPSLEAALANKYGAMLTLSRDPGKRAQDGVDFYFMVKRSMQEGQEPIDLEQLAALGEKVWPGGGAQEIIRFVEQAKAGKVPSASPPEVKGSGAGEGSRG
jgi:hypothetical protein